MGVGTVDGLRARKKERTHRDLVQAGLRMFAERGFDAVTVEDIAAEVDVSPRTFYRYFPAKEDLLLDDLSTALDVLRTSFHAQPAALSAMAATRAALLEVTQTYEGLALQGLERARIVEANPSLKLRLAERQAAWEQVLAPLVSERLGDPPSAPSLQAQLIASCAVAALRVAFAAWRVDEGKVGLIELAEEALNVLGDKFGQGKRPLLSGVLVSGREIVRDAIEEASQVAIETRAISLGVGDLAPEWFYAVLGDERGELGVIAGSGQLGDVVHHRGLAVRPSVGAVIAGVEAVTEHVLVNGEDHVELVGQRAGQGRYGLQ